MGIFVLSDGEEYEVKGHNGPIVRILAERQYIDKKGEEGVFARKMPEQYVNSSDERYEKEMSLVDSESFESFKARDVYLIAKNKEEKKEVPFEYHANGASCNSTLKQRVEVILQVEEWRKELYFEWEGKNTFYDFMRNLDEIDEEIYNGDLEEQGCTYEEEADESKNYKVLMYKTDGRIDEIPLTMAELKDSIISVRLIGHELLIHN